jgi:outer membrane biosynthesis protein TonB
VLIEYNVTELGNVDEARVLETNAAPRQASQILEAFRSARFRPRFVNGAPVTATGLHLREVYRVRKDDDEDDQQQTAEKS